MGNKPEWQSQNFKKNALADGSYDQFENKGKLGLGPMSAVNPPDAASVTGKYSFPLMVPTLTKKEQLHLLDGNDPTPAIYKKAEKYANSRVEAGRSPFAEPDELDDPQEDY